ncbi:hypothetical protein PVA17_19885 [Lysinibacillus sp. CNPSo 3705]|uniref:hypothetical protein n=1 Tax=Lysinibacillus sp. CNPSo 3705 TaxID=3028148 RepID=UPI00104C1729|nr:hypothetical protein [Lysinibacillus sp. CNPSo 3705]MDD1505004.1 hypothetical protein [Lysinibacillus sp. CNPSo 3705]
MNFNFMNDGMSLDEMVEHINFSPLLLIDKKLQNIFNFSLRQDTKDNRSSIYFYAKLRNGSSGNNCVNLAGVPVTS